VWEVSATSDSHGMRFAYEDDWTSLIAMYKYGRGAVDYSKPSWAFSYGIAVYFSLCLSLSFFQYLSFAQY